MTKYRTVVFLSGDEFDKWYAEFESEGMDNAFEYLLQWEYGESGEIYESPPWGLDDTVYTTTDGPIHYVVSYNWNLSYVSLTEVIR